MGLNSTLSVGATDWIAANWLIEATPLRGLEGSPLV